MLPLDPAVRPRSKIDRPNQQICSRSRLRCSAPRHSHPLQSERLLEEIDAAEVPRLERECQRLGHAADRRGPRHTGIDASADAQHADPERADHRSRDLSAGDDEAAGTPLVQLPRDLRHRPLHQKPRLIHPEARLHRLDLVGGRGRVDQHRLAAEHRSRPVDRALDNRLSLGQRHGVDAKGGTGLAPSRHLGVGRERAATGDDQRAAANIRKPRRGAGVMQQVLATVVVRQVRSPAPSRR